MEDQKDSLAPSLRLHCSIKKTSAIFQAVCISLRPPSQDILPFVIKLLQFYQGNHIAQRWRLWGRGNDAGVHKWEAVWWLPVSHYLHDKMTVLFSTMLQWVWQSVHHWHNRHIADWEYRALAKIGRTFQTSLGCTKCLAQASAISFSFMNVKFFFCLPPLPHKKTRSNLSNYICVSTEALLFCFLLLLLQIIFLLA